MAGAGEAAGGTTAECWGSGRHCDGCFFVVFALECFCWFSDRGEGC